MLLSDLLSVLADPAFVPGCSINPIISCGSVMQTWQASVFGIANPILGVVGFAALTGMALVPVTGGRLPTLMWWGILVGTAGGVVFTHWLAYQSFFQLGSLCPYCVVVWAVTLTTCLAAVSALAGRGHLPRQVGVYVWVVLPVWVVTLFTVTLIRFWDFWQTQI